jgi:hypothetical protein
MYMSFNLVSANNNNRCFNNEIVTNMELYNWINTVSINGDEMIIIIAELKKIKIINSIIKKDY